jgi:hypothetical protein
MSTRALRVQRFAHETLTEIHGNSAATTETEVSVLPVQLLAPFYGNLSKPADTAPFNKCLLSHEMQELDFSRLRPTTLVLPRLNGSPLHEVAEYVVENYAHSHHIPGVEYLMWLYKNPGESPANLKNHGNRRLVLVGSAFHYGLGPWKAPCAIWNETEAGFFKWADDLSRLWGPDCRAVLLEKLD